MDDNIYKEAWEKLYNEKYLKQLEELTQTKKKLNMLAEEAGITDLFEVEDGVEKKQSTTVSIQPGQFLGKKPATAVTMILTAMAKPLTFDQILEYLKQGSFDVQGSGGDKKLKETIAKNTTTFKLLPHSNGLYGLKAWYDTFKKGGKKNGKDTGSEEDSGDDELVDNSEIGSDASDQPEGSQPEPPPNE